MPTSDNQLYARSFADVYDAWYGDLDDPAHLVGAVMRRCEPPALVLELGSGTGRLAAPLQQADYRVIAIDISSEMLRDAIAGPLPITADMTQVPLRDRCVDVALIAYNTLFNVADRDLQQRCFDEAARVLRPGGLLAVEAFVGPSQGANEFGISRRPHPTDPGAELSIVTGPHASIDGVIVGAHIETGDQTICRPWQLAYQSPSELDAAAARAGLGVEARFRDWSDTAFTPDAARHVTWYKSHQSDLR